MRQDAPAGVGDRWVGEDPPRHGEVVRIDIAIIVEEAEQRSPGRAQRRVARARQARRLLAQQPRRKHRPWAVGERAQHRLRLVGRAVVDDDKLHPLGGEQRHRQAREHRAQRLGAIARAQQDRERLSAHAPGYLAKAPRT